MKLFLLFLLLLVAFCSTGDARKSKLRIRRHVPQRFGSRSHYHHDPRDENSMSVVVPVGTPQQDLELLFDTTVSDVFVPLCPKQLNQTYRECFDASASTTFKRLTADTAQDMLSRSMIAKGNMFTFITTEYRPDVFGGMGTAGIGWPSLRKHPSDSYFPENVTSLAIGIDLDGCESSIDFDGTCKTNAGSVYLPITSKSYWQFTIKDLHLGKFNESVNGQMVIATNKEYIGMPKKFLDQLTSLHGIIWEADYGAYSVECDKASALPDLHFVTDGGVVTIPAKSYVYVWEPLSNGRCVVNFEDSKAFGFGPEWYIGIQIVTDYCVTLDYKNARIVMTKNKEDNGNLSCHEK
ncbi:hypothetical protein QR680_015301 [Steinernema hermaphroditum]|uniref:Peptidase A1 domain-containing protein n=1 Tax=Steinernema hermaphroditum TaxID=289476 RepID=A0AA39LKH0_9BILA|nr:hypothetical protein QR680_015301 [Steinernema hermaphroditum]